jgi:hypothetical protein
LHWKRSKDRFVQIDVEVKDWVASPPSVEAARPGRCPGCGAASRPVGEPLQLVGHGVRSRQLRGPAVADGPADEREVQLRRYRCLACEAVVAVGPRGLIRHRLFSGGAIALALALWARGATASEVRRRVSPWRIVGAAAAAGWRTLRRWAEAAREGRLWPRSVGPAPALSGREAAVRVARKLAALAPGLGPTWILAFAGAARAR